MGRGRAQVARRRRTRSPPCPTPCDLVLLSDARLVGDQISMPSMPTPFSPRFPPGAPGSILKILDRGRHLGVMFGPRRQLAVVHGPQFPAHRLGRKRRHSIPQTPIGRGRQAASARRHERQGSGSCVKIVSKRDRHRELHGSRHRESNQFPKFGNPFQIRINNESWYEPPDDKNRGRRGIAHGRSNGLARRLPPDLTPARGLWRDLRDTLIARDHRAILIVLSAVASAEKLTGRRVSSVI